MTEWKTRVGYLPRDLADEARHVVIDRVPEEAQYEVMRFIERAFGAGYQEAYIRSHADESWRQHRADEAAKKKLQKEGQP